MKAQPITPAEKISQQKTTRPLKDNLTRNRYWKPGIRRLRTELRLTLSDVAKQTGMSKAGLSEIERGTDVMLTTAKKLCEFYGRTVEELWPELLKQ